MAKTVLIVEDEEFNMRLLRDLLVMQGYQTLCAADGISAIYAARARKPDLILMDIRLPELSGLDATIRIKADQNLKDIPIIAITAFAMDEDEEKIRASGCDEFMAKPIRVEYFLETVNRLLNCPSENGTSLAATTEKVEVVSADDLTTIRGIGIVTQNRLIARGIRSYAQLARTAPNHVRNVLGGRVRGAQVEEWISQAQKLTKDRQLS